MQLNSQQDYIIYSYFLNGLEIGKAILSPFSDEKHPSFRVTQSRTNGKLYHIDYARSQYKGSSIDFVMQLLNIPYGKAIEEIKKILEGEIIDTIVEWEPEEHILERESHIIIESQPFSKAEIRYFKNFGIDDLTDILTPKRIWYNEKEIYPQRGKYKCVFAYRYWVDGLPKYKLYRPFGDKKAKWFLNNVPNTVIDGEIAPADVGIITKSRKDYRVVKQVYPNVIGVQNEGFAILTNDLLQRLKTNWKKIYLWWDNDSVGIENGKLLAKTHGLELIVNPEGVGKDPAEWRYNTKSLKPIKNFIWQKVGIPN